MTSHGLCLALVFSAPSADAQTFRTIYNFTGIPNTAAGSFEPLMAGAGGVLYGSRDSAVYSLSPPPSPGGVWTAGTLAALPADAAFVTRRPVAANSDAKLRGFSDRGRLSRFGSIKKAPLLPSGRDRMPAAGFVGFQVGVDQRQKSQIPAAPDEIADNMIGLNGRAILDIAQHRRRE